MSKRITIPYDPDTVGGEMGWIWLEDAFDPWHMILTDNGDAGADPVDEEPLLASIWTPDDWLAGPQEREAESLRGLPYLPLCVPGCGPRAGLLVAIMLPHGASVAHSWETPGAQADQAREAVLAALLPGRRQE